ncbi:alpha/beta fold hydrolase [Saccharopolyspora sp. K220]|uniref:alpha/beta fold hydrolase n=1 Tax=Saccharopolyspora soli TaxID=2926618 RepID=UPI001F597EA5|nr:alpha/beta fold hydrolase [Saccharopolyspora soli]MCI2419839.1 alpha/beta fold hydrolase [Saccharopolyspora soli]
MVEPITLLLVHSPLVGPLTWDLEATSLRHGGQRVVVPSLAAVADDGPPYYRNFAAAAARALEVAGSNGPVVLVGHSGAGALLPAVAGVVGDDARGAVFVDAILPHPGSSWFDTAPEQLREQLAGMARAGRLPPWNEWFPSEVVDTLLPDAGLRERFIAELPKLPLACFEEPAPDVPDQPASRCAYVRLSEAYDGAAEEAERRGWRVHRENADHLAMLTEPDRIADAISHAVTAVTDA